MSDSAPLLKEIFAKALECTSKAERDRYLTAACGGDDKLHAEVESLLKADTDAGSFLEHPAADVGDAAKQARERGPASDIATEAGTKQGELRLDFLAPAQKEGSLGRLGHYEVLEVVGRGGMGIVLKAFDEKLQRVVAIKTMLAQLATSANARQRFVREAQAAAAIRNEHVIDIHAVEETAELPYLVMEYVSGVSLQERLDRSRLQLQEILRIGMQAARGLAAAHAQGLVHRDVKPANILLENGVERVKITDFGLARTVDDASLTQSGIIAGTPQFMAPEQARGEHVDHRADLFGLGSLLYVMCTGRPPFHAETTMGVLKRVCEDTPHAIRDLNPEIPDWLVAMIARLLAKNPGERFASAAEVAHYLENGLAHLLQPSAVPTPAVAAGRPASAASSRRRRWLAAAAAALLVASAVVALPGILDWMRRKDEQGQNGPVAPPENSLQVRPRATLKGHTSVYCLAFDADGKKLASAGAHGDLTIKLWDLTTGKDLATLTGHKREITGVAFTPDGTTLASASLDRTVRLWDVAAGKEREPALHHSDMVWALAISPDGKTLAAGGSDSVVKFWDIKTGNEQGVSLAVGTGVRSVAFAPNGKTLAVTLGSVNDAKVQLWNLETREVQTTLQGHQRGPECVAFNPDDNLLATGGHDRTVILWDVASGKKLKTLYHENLVQGVAFSADGRILASCDGLYNRPEEPGEVKLWDVATRKGLLTLPPHPGCVFSVAFSPRGNILATACADGAIRLWDVRREK